MMYCRYYGSPSPSLGFTSGLPRVYLRERQPWARPVRLVEVVQMFEGVSRHPPRPLEIVPCPHPWVLVPRLEVHVPPAHVGLARQHHQPPVGRGAVDRCREVE
eukprot:386847-Prorocentrum_minimum.AAC.1